ncbi:hypothetical protein ABPG72_007493 [Tetrahymena utriculariae]
MSEAAKAAAIKRSTGSSKPSTKSTTGSSKVSEKYYSGESGIKVQPKSVLIISLVYMGIVLLLHIFSKLRGGSAPTGATSTDQ